MPTVEQFELRHARPKLRGASLSGPVAAWQLAVGWLLLLPMLYIAANGILVPRTGDVSFAATGEDPASPASHKIGVAVICLICFTLIFFHFSDVLALSRRVKLVLAFPVLAILSAAWSADPRQSLVSGGIILVFTLFAIYVATQFSLQKQFELIMLVGAVALPVSIALAVFVPSLGKDALAWRGIFGHKQNCSAVCTLWLVTALHWHTSGVYQRIFRAIYVFMCFTLIVMSQSRTGWALTLVALFLSAALWSLQKMPATNALAFLMLALPVLAAALYVIHMFAPSLLASVGKDSTLSQRTIIWSAAWGAISQHPILGYGFAAFWRGLYGPSQAIVLVAGWGLAQAQDGFLDVWLGLGVLGVGLVALVTGQAMRNAVRTFYSNDNHSYVRWCIVVIVCTLLYNIGESAIGLFNMTWFLFILASIGLGQAAMKKIESRAPGVYCAALNNLAFPRRKELVLKGGK
jgi:O-antigen ligase